MGERLEGEFAPTLKPVINATGIVLHTGLGRAPLSPAARDNVSRIMSGYCSLEIDLESGRRGERSLHVEHLLQKITGAEAARAVNNNAAAVFLALNTLSFAREAIISRGQLVEIGGSFRMPDVMDKSGVIMREVGTTNKTKLADYRSAISEKTGAIVVAHTSNYRVLGFTAEVALAELAQLAHDNGLPLLHDLGAGAVVDLRQYGLPYEPLVQDSLAAGADVVTFSGDKVLGGPQSGILVGKKEWIERIHQNPIMRAVRCGKLTYAALEATLRLFFQQGDLAQAHRALQRLTEPVPLLETRAKSLLSRLDSAAQRQLNAEVTESWAQTGSGALPLEKLPSRAVVCRPENVAVEQLAFSLRHADPPVLGYVREDALYLDMRTVEDEELDNLAAALNGLFPDLSA